MFSSFTQQDVDVLADGLFSLRVSINLHSADGLKFYDNVISQMMFPKIKAEATVLVLQFSHQPLSESGSTSVV